MKIFRIIAAILGGLILGSVVNIMFITIGSALVPAPPGVDVNDAESIAAGIHLFAIRHFIFPFLAHAAGTFVGALVAFAIARHYREGLAWLLGGLNLLGGIAAATMIPAPIGFLLLDLVLAYLPMAYLAIWVGRRWRPAAAV
ncbi:MAG: hypothetical protein AAGI72_21220 [Pseudomonadota bacterium]